jgi:cyclic pyranopterin phosphate synthase
MTDELVVPSEEVLSRIQDALGALSAGGGPMRGNGPAEYYHLGGAVGSIGVITPMTHTYCGSCNRVRLTADGRLRTCLFGDHEVDLRAPLRAGEPLAPFVRQALADKPEAHALLSRRVGGLRALSQVGG